MLDFSHEFNNYSTVDLNSEFNIHFMGYYLNTYFMVYFNDYFAMHFSTLSLKKNKFHGGFWIDDEDQPFFFVFLLVLAIVECDPLIGHNTRVGCSQLCDFWGMCTKGPMWTPDSTKLKSWVNCAVLGACVRLGD